MAGAFAGEVTTERITVTCTKSGYNASVAIWWVCYAACLVLISCLSLSWKVESQVIGISTSKQSCMTEINSIQNASNANIENIDVRTDNSRPMLSGTVSETKEFLTILVRLLGETFTLNPLVAALGIEQTCAESVLRQLREDLSGVIQIQPQLEQPMAVKEVLHVHDIKLDENAAMVRVLTLLAKDMERAERKLYVEGQNAAYSYLQDEWPNMNHVISMDSQCTEDCYEAYLKVALKADKLLVKRYPKEALPFYHTMADVAEKHGRPERERAVLQGLVGLAITQGSGTDWEEAMKHFQRALPVLKKDVPSSVDLVRLLCDMGFAYFRMNMLEEADRFLVEARKAIEKLSDDVDEVETSYHLIRVRSNLALPAIFRGQWDRAKAALEEALGMCEDVLPHHPILPTIYNSLGLLYERSGEDHDKALDYYVKALEERRSYAHLIQDELVPHLNNIAGQYCLRRDFDTAFRYLKEADDIRSRAGEMHYFTALTKQHFGDFYLQKGDYSLAEENYQKASKIYATCTPRHDIRCSLELYRAHVFLSPPLYDVTRVQDHLRQVCALAEDFGDNFTDHGPLSILSAIEHLVQLNGWHASGVQTSINLALQRLDSYPAQLTDKMIEHRAILTTLVAMEKGGASEEEKQEITSRISNACLPCRLVPFDTKEPRLWRQQQT